MRKHESSSVAKSGLKGVHTMRQDTHRAIITHKGKQIYLGVYDTPEAAAAARNGGLMLVKALDEL
ncbi:TPA: hypothetical protein JLG68_001368 [Escherichia coli]|nr:hypothetical protein [Escherichia coli]